MTTDIELVSKALSDFDVVAAGLEQLNKTYKGALFDVETYNGMEMAKAARVVLRRPRYEIERIRKEAKAPLLAIGRKLDSEAARITAEIMKLENPIDEQIKNEDERKKREMVAKAEAEQKRQAEIQARIEAIRMLPSRAIGKPSHEVKALLEQATAMVIDDSFAEFIPQANTALQTTVLALQGAFAERQNHEAEQARIVAERAELERLRAEQTERDRIERERLAEQDRLAKIAREAESAKHAEELRKQRDVIDVENKRLAEERAAFERQQAEAKRLADEAERARLATEAAERQRREAAALAAKKSKYPGDQAILDALAKHFEVSEQVVRGWLVQLKAAA